MFTQQELVQLDKLLERTQLSGSEADNFIKLRQRIAQEYAALQQSKVAETVKEEKDGARERTGSGSSSESKPGK